MTKSAQEHCTTTKDNALVASSSVGCLVVEGNDGAEKCATSAADAKSSANTASPSLSLSSSSSMEAESEASSSLSPSPSPSGTLPLRFVSKVRRGFGRGSKDLGIPTANLDYGNGGGGDAKDGESGSPSLDALPCGIYWGFARIGERSASTATATASDNGSGGGGGGGGASALGVVHKAAVSIGYNPTYRNSTKTIEPHLIADPDHPNRRASKCGETVLDDFYGQPIRLSVAGYIRPERAFDTLQALIDAIKGDIAAAERLCDGHGHDDAGTMARREREWVQSDQTVDAAL